MSAQPTVDIFDYSPRQLAELMHTWGETAFRVKQIIAAAWKPNVSRFSDVSTLPKLLRQKLDAYFSIPAPWIPKQRLASSDGTVKGVFELADGAQIESVSIPLEGRLTFCLSSQVGCAMGCRFCATARMGFIRNLTAGEISGQLRSLMHLVNQIPTNIVLMGMGEPLQNLDAVRTFTELIHHPQALSWSPKKTTVSTSGWIPGITAITEQPLPARLAFSLNAVTDEVRTQIMPINRRFPLAEVMTALKKYAHATQESITIEYVLIRGVNDRIEDARILARLLKSLPSKINLIPWNEIPGIDLHAPTSDSVQQFKLELAKMGALAIVRVSRGSAIGAACGQLARQHSRRAA